MTDKCDEEIYKNGKGVAVMAGPSRVIEAIVSRASELSGIKMDWHYVGGRAMVKTLGDNAKAADALETCMPQLLR